MKFKLNHLYRIITPSDDSYQYDVIARYIGRDNYGNPEFNDVYILNDKVQNKNLVKNWSITEVELKDYKITEIIEEEYPEYFI